MPDPHLLRKTGKGLVAAGAPRVRPSKQKRRGGCQCPAALPEAAIVRVEGCGGSRNFGGGLLQHSLAAEKNSFSRPSLCVLF